MSSKDASVMSEQKNEKQALVPRLRFSEFQGGPEWKIEPLRKLAQRCTSKNIKGKHTRVLTNSAEHGVVDQRDYFDKDIATQGKLEGYYIVEKGDYVYNPRISMIAPVGPISKNNVGTGVMSPLYTVFRFSSSDNDFFAHYFKSTHWHHYMRQASSTGARHDRMSIPNGDFMSLPLPVSNPREQQKISDCLSSLDDLIAAETHKLNVLKKHKKGLMQQLFPSEGETVPYLRFPEFRDTKEWEPTTVGEIANFKSGGTPSKGNPAFWNGSIPWASAKDMKQLFLDDTEDHITSIAVDNGAKQVPAGTVLILTRGMTLLKDVPICILNRQMSFNQDVKALEPKGDFDGRFLAYLLLSCKQQLLSLVDIAGHGTGRLDTDKLKEFDVMLPQPAEQQRIADCLSLHDSLVVAQGLKIYDLKVHKKGLMQQLFPALDEAQV